MTAQKDDGSISIEYVLLTPLVFLVLALIYAFARVVNVDGNLDSATRDAARVATQAPDMAHADTAVSAVLTNGFGSFRCTNNLTPPYGPKFQINGTFGPGQTLTVVATCVYAVSDIGLPGAPGTVTATSQFSSIIDPNRTLP